MATTVQDIAYAGDYVYWRERVELRDAAYARDGVTTGTNASLRDTAWATDRAGHGEVMNVSDHGYAKDIVSSAGQRRQGALKDAAQGRDKVVPWIHDTLKDVAYAEDKLPPMTQAGKLRDSAVAKDLAVARPTITKAIIADTAKACDVMKWAVSAKVSDAARGVDELIAYACVFERVSDIATARDAAESAYSVREQSCDTARGRETVSGRATLVKASVFDYAYAADYYTASNDNAPRIALVTNLLTGSVSRYDGMKFDSVAVVRGRTLLAGAGGLFEMRHTSAEKVSATIKLRVDDLGSDVVKSVSAVYLGGSGDLLKTGVVAGENPEYQYMPVAGGRDNRGNSRAVLGRGLRGRAWQFTFTNVEGTPFTLNNIEAATENSQRRIK